MFNCGYKVVKTVLELGFFTIDLNGREHHFIYSLTLNVQGYKLTCVLRVFIAACYVCAVRSGKTHRYVIHVHVHAGFGITSEYSHRLCDIYAYAQLEV